MSKVSNFMSHTSSPVILAKANEASSEYNLIHTPLSGLGGVLQLSLAVPTVIWGPRGTAVDLQLCMEVREATYRTTQLVECQACSCPLTCDEKWHWLNT